MKSMMLVLCLVSVARADFDWYDTNEVIDTYWLDAEVWGDPGHQDPDSTDTSQVQIESGDAAWDWPMPWYSKLKPRVIPTATYGNWIYSDCFVWHDGYMGADIGYKARSRMEYDCQNKATMKASVTGTFIAKIRGRYSPNEKVLLHDGATFYAVLTTPTDGMYVSFVWDEDDGEWDYTTYDSYNGLLTGSTATFSIGGNYPSSWPGYQPTFQITQGDTVTIETYCDGIMGVDNGQWFTGTNTDIDTSGFISVDVFSDITIP